MENKILKQNNEVNLYLIEYCNRIVIVNNRVGNKSIKNYKYWDYYGNENFSLQFSDENTNDVEGEAIVFHNNNDLKYENYEFIYDLILNAMISSHSFLISDILDIIEKYFRNIYSVITKEQLQGLFAEFVFIKYMMENKCNIQSSYHKFEKSDFDFYFNASNKYVELKSAINDIHDYSISHRQLNYDSNNTFLVTINLWPDENGISLLELFNKIKFTDPDLIEKVKLYQGMFENDLFVKEQKYSINKYEIKIYEGNILPKLSISDKDMTHIKNIKYDISTAGLPILSLESFIDRIL